MNMHISFFVMAVLAVGIMGVAHAHKSEIVGDYKLEVGWKNEPPIAGKKNAIEITVTKVSQSEKDAITSEHGDSHGSGATAPEHGDSHDSDNVATKDAHGHKESKKNGVSGLRKALEADITLDGKKTFLKLLEAKKRMGYYYGTYTPEVEGHPTVHVVGQINDMPVEITLHPEKVEPAN